MTLSPCPCCHRHVHTDEARCPFCAVVLASPRAQHAAILGRVSRAAVFSAALVGCNRDEPKSAPASPTPTVQPADAASPADASVPPDAALADAGIVDAFVSDAASTDAGATPDAGVRVEKKQREPATRQDGAVTKERLDPRHMAKPYGAPPARRRVV